MTLLAGCGPLLLRCCGLCPAWRWLSWFDPCCRANIQAVFDEERRGETRPQGCAGANDGAQHMNSALYWWFAVCVCRKAGDRRRRDVCVLSANSLCAG